ncbi:hypothetical protein Patl1_23663 [Pistacia atlantica]|uniref:Uncharacterized protein n=1 Tax=Pistacia atlantica TaxID=434234 RepID=A0ACC1A280_9ROSI|nr:hypothetical protein Patl1_23663 [Pistacia atlantica]
MDSGFQWSIIALEAVSYLMVLGLLNGPFGLLRAVEDLPYLALLAILVVLVYDFLKMVPFQDFSQPTGALVEIM